MKRWFLVMVSILLFVLGLFAQPLPSADASATGFQGAQLLRVAHRRHAHRAGHHRGRRHHAHRRHA